MVARLPVEAALFARAFGNPVDILARRHAETVMGHIVLILGMRRPAAEQDQHEIVLRARAREPNRAALALSVLADAFEPAIAAIKGDRLIEIAHMQRALEVFKTTLGLRFDAGPAG